MDRAVVRSFDPDGKNLKTYATGLRNCSGLAVHPATGARLVRGQRARRHRRRRAARIRDLGARRRLLRLALVLHRRPRGAAAQGRAAGPEGARRSRPTSCSRRTPRRSGITFYDGLSFPADYRGSAFVALHGSWNRSERAGYKVVRLPMKDGKATGVYEDFLTGFVVDAKSVWGRPVGVGVLKDGSLLVSDDGSGSIWRVRTASRRGAAPPLLANS